MKNVKYFLVVAALFYSVQTMACKVDIKVVNATGTTLTNVSVCGPWSRHSTDHSLDDGEDFTYHASGSAFSCHGKYSLGKGSCEGSGSPHCTMRPDWMVKMKKDGLAVLTILEGKDGKWCKVSNSKTYY